MMQCLCGSYAINHHLHGRLAGKYEDMCDVCYWRISHKALQYLNAELLEALESSNLLLRTARHSCEATEVCRVLDVHIERNAAAIAKARSQA